MEVNDAPPPFVTHACLFQMESEPFLKTTDTDFLADGDATLKGELVHRLPAPEQSIQGPVPYGVELFAFPNGITLSRARVPPSLHSFVLTMVTGERMYACRFLTSLLV
jgi:hypothetical protein